MVVRQNIAEMIKKKVFFNQLVVDALNDSDLLIVAEWYLIHYASRFLLSHSAERVVILQTELFASSCRLAKCRNE